MEIIINPPRGQWSRITARNIPPDDAEVTETVERIVSGVATGGDDALRLYARLYDGAAEDAPLELSAEEWAEGLARVPAPLARAIDSAAGNIRAFHAAQMPQPVEVETAPGVRCVQRAVPIGRVGLYVPGGSAPLFSTVLMLAVPARLAGCSEVLMCTPVRRGEPVAPAILYAARMAGVDRIFKVGGAHAISAMAYGTPTVPRVDKIFGPGNRYVTKAKQLVSAVTAIDMPAGPSEVMILADDSAKPAFVAADMLSQAEHGPDSQAIAVCTTPSLALAVEAEVARQAALLPRRTAVEGSLAHSRIVVPGTPDECLELANLYAPEHLIIAMRDPWAVAAGVKAAGSVFVGPYSPESAGDYASGTNHTLPTGGWARSLSGVNLDSYMRRITFQELTPDGLGGVAPVITAMAKAEGLDAHAAAVAIRTEGGGL